MNALERLEAAIAKLEALKAEAYERRWAYARDDDGVKSVVSDPDGMNFGVFAFHPDACFKGDRAHPDDRAVKSAELIVTLHRTIDAQLGVLRDGAQSIKSSFFAMVNAAPAVDQPPGPYWQKSDEAWRVVEHTHRRPLALADSILGVQQ